MSFIRIIVASLVVLVASTFATSNAHAQTNGRFAQIAIDYETGSTLIAENETAILHPASLTKVMTLYMLFEALEDGRVTLETRIPISRRAAQQPATRLGFRCPRRARVCGSISVDNAINALIVLSANDVATAVAEFLGRSESNFALRMTRRAHDMGMPDTVFVNASGLPSVRQVTTAHDMAVLGRRLIEDYPDYYARFSVESFTFGRRTIRGHNRVMYENDEVDGIKTGYTRSSGFNLISSAVRDGRRVITVVLGGNTAGERDAQMVNLIDQAFDRQAELPPREIRPYEVNTVGLPLGLPLDDQEYQWTPGRTIVPSQ